VMLSLSSRDDPFWRLRTTLIRHMQSEHQASLLEGGLLFETSSCKVSKTPSQQNTNKRAGGVAQAVENLPSMPETLGSNPCGGGGD
jgi:hypothetical protein